MSNGERGCAMSHAVIWHACAARGDGERPMIVFEDDAELCAGFNARCARHIANIERAIPDPRERTCIFYLGGDVMEWRKEGKAAGHEALKPGAVGDTLPPLALPSGLREAQYVYQTSSYVLWPAAARVLLTQLPIDGPVDCFMSRLYLERKLRAIYARPR